ncbi:NADPH-dependent FMN reductase [Afifella marina]|uniref:NAD(P)H-dependent FMN reductase n=1 Tax=Afifella marina DSM 2698 TaxID=1120955 RepID=A0A1G5NCT2_AFIMA|nr:NAD(P)H-dependent oxidoreductase [Afifella marina]MBK1623315.1 NADPH-dependent oxidoreductase [Afifella marina DSM 2698]MBK1626309.1 NADPH-dependent oxidoreductase [Afifella marina]MBK5917187.1 hypothetical protein [Afifella marina]RAI22160.1 hypothetical protein CH311_05555 [Afifella marina DSM 2698]SCZ35206.1 NAD(P)H-dependent FMN reductase [Afifella marina DSM 2698]
MAIRVLVLPGSLSSGSLNTRLAAAATKTLALRGAEVTRVSLGDYPLPFYEGDVDLRGGVPEKARALARQLRAHDAVLIVSPEDNAGIPAVLKNAIDWMGREDVKSFRDRVFALASASSDPFGGLCGLLALRQVLEASALGALVIPEHFLLPDAENAFDEREELKDRTASRRLDGVLQALMQRGAALKLARES